MKASAHKRSQKFPDKNPFNWVPKDVEKLKESYENFKSDQGFDKPSENGG